jgi:hypothetical protein
MTLDLPISEASPSTLVNSVTITSGRPQELIIRRKTVSVTSSIGANTKNGLDNDCQNDCIGLLNIRLL